MERNLASFVLLLEQAAARTAMNGSQNAGTRGDVTGDDCTLF
jgi:hypothetical protein